MVSPTKTLFNSDNIIFCYLEGRKHDAAMLKDSHLLDYLNGHAFSATGEAMCLYGDPAYPHRIHLQGPFKEQRLTPAMGDFNSAMSSVRSSVECVFGDVIGSFKFLDFKKKSQNWSKSSWQTLHSECSA